MTKKEIIKQIDARILTLKTRKLEAENYPYKHPWECPEENIIKVIKVEEMVWITIFIVLVWDIYWEY